MSLEHYFGRILMEIKVLISVCLLIIWIAYLNLELRIIEICELMMRSMNCLFVRILENGRRHIARGFGPMTHLAITHCVVVIGLRRIVTVLLLSQSVALSNGIFAWLVLINIVYSFVLLNCLYE